MKKKAFTLAEVLITLTIIGVIAALTIPTLMQKHQEQEMITGLKKAHSVLSNAYQLAIRENGNVSEWDIKPGRSAEGSGKWLNYITPYLKVQKNCGNNKEGCWANKHKSLTGKETTAYTDGKDAFAILEDGSAISFWLQDPECKYEAAASGIVNFCGNIAIDVNGPKGPNKLGVDTFAFWGENDRIVPSKNKTFCKYNDNNTSNGVHCTWWTISKGNMDYLRRDISNEW